MRALLYLAELVAALAIVFAAVKGVRGVMHRRRAPKDLGWKRRVVALPDGRVQIEVAKAGSEHAVPVETLDPKRPDFDVACYAAEAKADDLAMTLNANEDE